MSAGGNVRSFALAIALSIATLIGCRVPDANSATAFDAAAVRTALLHAENEMNLTVDRGDCSGPYRPTEDFEPPRFVSNGRARWPSPNDTTCKHMVSQRVSAVFVPDTITAHAFSNDAGYVVREGNYTVNYRDGRTRTAYMVMTTIWHREPGGWKCVHLHESVRRDK